MYLCLAYKSRPFRANASSILSSMASRRVLDNALDAVGNTPLVRLDKIAAEQGLKCNLCTNRYFARCSEA